MNSFIGSIIVYKGQTTITVPEESQILSVMYDSYSERHLFSYKQQQQGSTGPWRDLIMQMLSSGEVFDDEGWTFINSIILTDNFGFTTTQHAFYKEVIR